MTNSKIEVQTITVTNINASTKKVIAVGATKHVKDTIGYKIRFTDKSANARVNTLIATKEHSDYLFYTLNVQASELAGALLALETGDKHNEQHTSASIRTCERKVLVYVVVVSLLLQMQVHVQRTRRTRHICISIVCVRNAIMCG